MLYMHLCKEYPELCETFDELMEMRSRYECSVFATEPDEQRLRLAKERALHFLKTIEGIRLKVQKQFL